MPTADLAWLLIKRPEFSDMWQASRKAAEISGKPPNVIFVPPRVRARAGEEWWADLKQFARLLSWHENRRIQITDQEPHTPEKPTEARG